MFICPGCGAGMRFDIETQKMKCDFCGAVAEPGEGDGREARREVPYADDAAAAAGPASADGSDAAAPGSASAGTAAAATADTANADASAPASSSAPAADTYDVTIFTCPQCGGEIMSTGNEAASFCSFCGSAVTMEGRLSNEKRPKWIIPFLRTKEDCKARYAGMTKKFLYAPSEFRDPEHLEKFTGIYLPFWRYSYSQDAAPTLEGTRDEGDTRETIDLTVNVKASYDGIVYDASSSFDDNLCNAIEPFEKKYEKPFSPAYLAGFFADTADVPPEVYAKGAERRANMETMRMIRQAHSEMSVVTPKDMTETFHTKQDNLSMALFPVWFLTWRDKDRVAYAVVNGVNGKIAADMPVDKKKYLIGSLITAVPLIALLLLLPTIKASSLMTLSIFIGLAVSFIYLFSLENLRDREEHVNDLGWQYRFGKMPLSEEGEKAAVAASRAKAASRGPLRLIRRLFLEADLKTKLQSIAPAIASLVALFIFFASPVADIPYYIGTVIILGAICYTLLGLIEKYNILATRSIPDFHDRKGA